ncbi:MAG: FGGY-family carbohydrate kinase [Anaerolineaceae bacterium]|nr:FGGY-family carbohydrate kinase [Anaerolineaceae bacterium]
MAGLLLGIDVGTYSSKGVLVEADGTVLKSQVVEHDMSIPHPGWAEQDADAVWWHDVVALCHGLLDGSPYTGADVVGVAMSAIGPCLLPVDASGRPLRPGILYGVDARASEEIDLLNESLGEAAVFDFSGMSFTSQAIGPKILWLQRQEPDVWAQTSALHTASSYMIYRLTGENIMDRHTASHYMPLIDIRALEWSDQLGSKLADAVLLPRLGWSDALAGMVNAQGAQETGLKPGTPVAVGAVDALSEAISVGAVQPGDLMMMYGSTAFFILVTEQPLPHPAVWTVAGAFAGQYNVAAGMATTGSLTRWFRDELARDLPPETAYNTLFAAAADLPPGADGLLMLPYFSGERTPINDPKARGALIGLTLSHTRDHIYRAALESVAYGIRHNLETFQEMGATIKRVVAVGGGTKSRTWLQIVSDVAGVEQNLPEITIGASYGDAFLAGMAAGVLNRSDLDRWVKPGTVITPEPDNRGVYDTLYRDYLALYDSTKDIMHRLAQ